VIRFFLTAVFKYRYLISLLAFIIWVIFFDQNKVTYQWEILKKCRQMENEKNFYTEQIQLLKNTIHAIQHNPDSMEMIAREEYLMKRPDEDLIVLTDSSRYFKQHP
jgi:cell division protein FtsB